MRGEDADPDREEYGRYGNPTVRELELRMAAIERTEEAVALSSGMAAMSMTLLSLLKAGDHVVLFNDGYRRTRQLVTKIFPRYGIEHTLVPPGDCDALARAITGATRVVVGESPTNPHLECTDLGRLASIVKEHGRVRTVVDSTFATPVNTRPHEYGVDLVVHSATKYLAGHNDVLGGVVTGPSHLVSLVRDTRSVLGAVLDPHAAFLIARGLKTLDVRIARQNATALAVAHALEKHPKVARVYYPGLERHPSHRVAVAQMKGFGGVVSFELKGGRAAAARAIDACKLATIASSLGGVETLIEQPAIMSYFELGPEELAAVGIEPGLVRLSVGIEDTEDVVRDLVNALDQV
jgi:cystathionine gamma-synthase